MAEPISDASIAAVLRPFVRVAGPLTDRLREADAFGLASRLDDIAHEAQSVAQGEAVSDSPSARPRVNKRKLRARVRRFVSAAHVPGTIAWQRMDPAQRTAWWVNRVGRLTTLVASVPGLGGALAERLPIGDAAAAASQGLLLCAIAGEHGITDTAGRVRLLAFVLFERKLPTEVAAGHHADRAAEDRRTEELNAEIAETKQHGQLRSVATAVLRLGRALLAVPDELQRRPRGRWYHRLLGLLPVAGMLGDYLGERSALKRAAKRADRWISEQKGATDVHQT